MVTSSTTVALIKSAEFLRPSSLTVLIGRAGLDRGAGGKK